MNSKNITPWLWVPTLYFAEGVPYFIVNNISVMMFTKMGVPNGDMAFFTTLLYFPWFLKGIWSPLVDVVKTKRWWILTMQALLTILLVALTFTLPFPSAEMIASGQTPISLFTLTLVLFIIAAFASATHDIAADGFYMLELDSHKQALYVGVRSTFYRLATIVCNGPLIMLAGALEVYYGVPARAWGVVFGISALVFLCFAAYHLRALPRPAADTPHTAGQSFGDTFTAMWGTFVTFFKKPGIIAALLFMLLYRFPEALLTPICKFFLIDPIEKGGLGLTTSEVGFVQGTVGVIGLLLGGILGGIAIARDGFGRWKWPMVFAISVPNLVYVYLAYFQPQDLWSVNTCIFLEQFGYGFGFTAYMMFLLYFAKGASETSHYAFCTGFMALSMMLPGLFAGWLQNLTGYLNFFILVIFCTPITLLVTSLIKVNPLFGRKETMVAQEN